MHPAIAQHRTGIATICQRFHVSRLEVFDSLYIERWLKASVQMPSGEVIKADRGTGGAIPLRHSTI